jgi:glycerol kinase
VDQTFSPDMSDEVRNDLVAGWKEAVKRSFGWEKPRDH